MNRFGEDVDDEVARPFEESRMEAFGEGWYDGSVIASARVLPD